MSVWHMVGNLKESWQGNYVQHVDGGRLSCPWQGGLGVDVEQCLVCQNLVAVDVKSIEQHVTCKPRPTALATEMALRSEY